MVVFEESTYRLPGYTVNSKVPFYPLKWAVQCVKYSTILGANLAVLISNGNWTQWTTIQGVIITITEFSNLIGYHQP